MEDFGVPARILKAAESVKMDLLADKSKIQYEKEYRVFCEWRDNEEVRGAGETVLLAYFAKLSNEYFPSSLWPKYSMLQACLELKEKIQIDKYGGATMLLNAGGDVLELQELGGWESSKVAKEYLEENLEKKISIARKIQIGGVFMASASGTKESMKMCAELSGRATGDVAVEMDEKDVPFSFHNCENIEINVQT